jgi:hypothetical protein
MGEWTGGWGDWLILIYLLCIVSQKSEDRRTEGGRAMSKNRAALLLTVGRVTVRYSDGREMECVVSRTADTVSVDPPEPGIVTHIRLNEEGPWIPVDELLPREIDGGAQ